MALHNSSKDMNVLNTFIGPCTNDSNNNHCNYKSGVMANSHLMHHNNNNYNYTNNNNHHNHYNINQASCATTTNANATNVDSNGKYVRYSAEQVQVLELLYNECPKPSSLRRQQLVRDNPLLQNIEPKQIKVWFQNRRCREKQRKESCRLQTVNSKLNAMNKLLMEENDRLRKQVAQMLYENGYIKQQLQQGGITTDTSCESVVTSGLQNHQHHHHHHHLAAVTAAAQQSPQDATFSGILALAEEILHEFLGKATGTIVDWVQMHGMKPGPDSTEMLHILNAGTGNIAARACGLVNMQPPKLIVDVIKDKPIWYRDCRRLTAMLATTTASGGTIEVLYTQMYAPTTLAPPRDFYTLRYTSPLEDGSYVVCERSVSASNGVAPMAPQVQPFIRAEMHASGCLIRPCDGLGSIVTIVDHMDLEAMTVPEVLRPLYTSSTLLAQRQTDVALKHLRHLAEERNPIAQSPSAGQQRPTAVRSLSHRLMKGFNDAVNGFADDGWAPVASTHGQLDDITIAVKSPPNYSSNNNNNNRSQLGAPAHKGILCAKASMLLQNVPPSLLIHFLREHRSEWADNTLEEALKMGNPGFSCLNSGLGTINSKCLQPQIHTLGEDEFLELIKMEICTEDEGSRDMFLLQLCSGLDSSRGCAQMVFAPVDASISEDVALIPSGFSVMPLATRHDHILDSSTSSTQAVSSSMRTLDLASSLEVGSADDDDDYGAAQQHGPSLSKLKHIMTNEHHHHHGDKKINIQNSTNDGDGDGDGNGQMNLNRAVLTIAFQFNYVVDQMGHHHHHHREEETIKGVALSARQYLQSVLSTVQRVAMAMAPSLPSSPYHNHNTTFSAATQHDEDLLLASWICKSYKLNFGVDLVHVDTENSKEYHEALWKLGDAVMSCAYKASPIFTFANQAGLDMLETTPMELKDLSWEQTFDELTQKSFFSILNQVMQQGYTCLPGGIRLSSMGRSATYDRAVVWKVVEEDQVTIHGVAFLYYNWSLHDETKHTHHHALLL